MAKPPILTAVDVTNGFSGNSQKYSSPIERLNVKVTFFLRKHDVSLQEFLECSIPNIVVIQITLTAIVACSKLRVRPITANRRGGLPKRNLLSATFVTW